MSADNVIAKIREIMAEMIGIAPVQISENTIIDNLGLDSIDRLELVMAIEEEFEIMISDEDCHEAKTIGELVEIVLKETQDKKGN